MPPRAKSARTKTATDAGPTNRRRSSTRKDGETSESEHEDTTAATSHAHLKHKGRAGASEGDQKEDLLINNAGAGTGKGSAHGHHGKETSKDKAATPIKKWEVRPAVPATEVKPRHRFSIDYAARNSRCQSCDLVVSINRPRVTHISPAGNISHYHAACLLPSLKADLCTTYGEPAYIEGFESIAPADQQAYLADFKLSNPVLDAAVAATAAAAAAAAPIVPSDPNAAAATVTGAAPGAAMTDAAHAAGIIPPTFASAGAQAAGEPEAGFEVVVARQPELAAGAVALCADCFEPIAAGEPRLGVRVRSNRRWRHLGCLYRTVAQLFHRETDGWTKLQGLAEFTPEEQRSILAKLDKSTHE